MRWFYFVLKKCIEKPANMYIKIHISYVKFTKQKLRKKKQLTK